MEYKEALELTGNTELAIKLLEADAKQTQAKAFAMIGDSLDRIAYMGLHLH
ncbi:hypothetical protein [Streptococcus hyointestinalis]